MPEAESVVEIIMDLPIVMETSSFACHASLSLCAPEVHGGMHVFLCLFLNSDGLQPKSDGGAPKENTLSCYNIISWT